MKINKNNKIVILNVIGLIMLIWYVWIRFIMQRLPKDIPFQLSLTTAIILLYICLTFIFIIKNIVKPKVSLIREYIFTIFRLIFKPLFVLDKSLRKTLIIQFIINKLAKYSYYFTSYDTTKNIISYYTWHFLPKYLFLLIFNIDIFYLHQLYFTYIFTILNIIPLIISYLIWLIRNNLEENILFIEKWYEVKIISTHPDPERDFADLLDPDGIDNFKVRTFLSYQMINNGMSKYECGKTWDVVKKYYPDTYDIQNLSHEQVETIQKDFYYFMPLIVNSHNFLNDLTIIFRIFNYFIKWTNVLLLFIFLIDWIYILVISLPTLTITNTEINFIKAFQDIWEPFSETKI